MGHRIVAYKARVRRTLCTAPVALPTLTHVWQQVARAEIPLTQVVRDVDATTRDQAAWHTQLGEALHRLQDLATRLRASGPPGPGTVGDGPGAADTAPGARPPVAPVDRHL